MSRSRHKFALTSRGLVAGTTPPLAPGGLDANSSLSYRNLFWHTIAQYNATYFSGHEHVPNVQQFANLQARMRGMPCRTPEWDWKSTPCRCQPPGGCSVVA